MRRTSDGEFFLRRNSPARGYQFGQRKSAAAAPNQMRFHNFISRVFLPTLIAIAATIGNTNAAGQEETGTLGPWRRGDMAQSTTLSDDRTNAESEQLKAKYYTSLVPERMMAGEKGELRFRIMPRAEGWAGILVLDKAGAPVLLTAGYKVAFADAEGRPVPGRTFDQKDTKVLFSDASAVILPRMRIVVTKGSNVVDEATMDFSPWKFVPASVQMSALLDGP